MKGCGWRLNLPMLSFGGGESRDLGLLSLDNETQEMGKKILDRIETITGHIAVCRQGMQQAP